ncbi:flagellar hook-associated protein FlgL [[Brevibacterium] frigoritolerans]|nr:flagellar hook-associated protein FlgL [Peribacillus frigoritolerans]
MRVSGFDKFKMTQFYLSNIQSDSQRKQEQIATGKIFNRVSDDPVRVNRSMLIDVTESRISQYQDNVTDTKSMLEYVDMTFEKASMSLQEAKELAIKGANDSYTAVDRQVIADGVEETIKQIVGFANAQHLDRYMFSGEKIDVEPLTYDGTTFTYNGNNNDMKINVSEQIQATVSQSAGTVFVPVLQELVKLRDALRSNSQGSIETAMKDVDLATNAFVDNRSRIGVQLQSLQLLEEAYKQTQTDLSVKRNQTEDINMADAISDFAYMQSIYQATVQSSVKMLNNSILEYI